MAATNLSISYTVCEAYLPYHCEKQNKKPNMASKVRQGRGKKSRAEFELKIPESFKCAKYRPFEVVTHVVLAIQQFWRQ